MTLRDHLQRGTIRVAAVVVLCVVVPVTVLAALHVAEDSSADHVRAVLLILGIALVAAVVAMGVGIWLSRRQAARLSEPLARLAQQASELGRSAGRSEPLHTAVVEVDAVSEVLDQRARELGRRLAHERDFAADASHQLRTPLTALLIRLEEITLEDDPEAMRAEASQCIDQVERLTGVVDQLLRRSRTSNGDPSEFSTSLDSVLARLQVEWQPAYAQARRSVKVAGERDLRVQVDPDTLAQILATLLENSLKHGVGLVEVDARRSGPSVVVEVTDEGPGVEPGIASHIFERRVTTGGTGLGLTLARDLATSSGGRLELRRLSPPLFALFLSEAVSSERDDAATTQERGSGASESRSDDGGSPPSASAGSSSIGSLANTIDR